MLINMTFESDDIKNSEHWKIRAMWKFLQEDFKELKHQELKEITTQNLQEIMDIIISYYVFSHTPDNNFPF